MSDWPETSETLIRRVRETVDDPAWDSLVSIYRPVIYRMARRRGLTHESAEDVVQTVFLSVSRAIPQWSFVEGGPKFRHWLGRIARNAIVNAITRARPDRATGSTSVAEILQALPSEAELSGVVLREARTEAIRYAANRIQGEFSERTWKIFQATAMEGRAAAIVAKDFGCSVGAVYASRCRVTARIREIVQEMSEFWSEET